MGGSICGSLVLVLSPGEKSMSKDHKWKFGGTPATLGIEICEGCELRRSRVVDGFMYFHPEKNVELEGALEIGMELPQCEWVQMQRALK
jgi:hypothetical protein